MTPLPLLTTHAPPIRVMALHALAYCPRLFYLEEVKEIRVADDRVYAGRELHASRQDLRDAIAEARRLRDSLERPPIAENERLCVRC